MKKKIISLIAASLMLAAPCLNAGLADWIANPKKEFNDFRHEVCLGFGIGIASAITPEQPSPEHRKLFFKMLEESGYQLKRPVFLAKNNLSKNLGKTFNHPFYSHVTFEENKDNIPQTLGHEIGHVIHEDDLEDNSAVFHRNTAHTFSKYAISGAALYTLYYRKFPIYLTLAAVFSYAYGHYAQSTIPPYSLEEQRKKELRAELTGYQLRQKVLNDIEGLEKDLTFLYSTKEEVGGNARQGSEYPTVDEQINLIQSVLNGSQTIIETKVK
jgi:hypothetical protein